MKTYPIMLKLQGRRAVVIGAGAVGLRRARKLLDAGADVTLAAAEIPAGADTSGMTVLRRGYHREILNGAFLVLACTDDRAINSRIAADARSAGVMVNVADGPQDCDFFLPAVHEEGDVVVAVGTGGLAPAMAVEIRDRLADALPPRVGEFAEAIGRLRGPLRDRIKNPAMRMEITKKLCGPCGQTAFQAGGAEALATMLEGMVKLLEGRQEVP